ncbi:hypothetical protein [Mycobacteroides chelonae]|uniref:hypothetical protein n=1 Tax=Mycobacteroides chelonae TaxID=1774 RepID=UPI0018B01EC8|nr:hypothetical protein [Mycobacteroides chelonae]MBF9523066.1 hypothetical protein [Mycobacteroides chelonae]
MTAGHEFEAQKRSQGLEQFTCPGLVEGGRVAVQLRDGTLVEGTWRRGRFVPDRPPAPWRITHRDGAWWIEKRHTGHYEPHCRLVTGAEAIATFAARLIR